MPRDASETEALREQLKRERAKAEYHENTRDISVESGFGESVVRFLGRNGVVSSVVSNVGFDMIAVGDDEDDVAKIRRLLLEWTAEPPAGA